MHDMREASGAVAAFEAAAARLAEARTALRAVVFGQEAAVELALTAVVAGGHALIVGAPGLAKTRLAAAMGRVLGLDMGRVQFTPDLTPADITGVEILTEGAEGRVFRFVEGPVFRQLLLADEINRASPRTQSALLQAMQEQAVTTAGVTRDLPRPFHVLATQNPIEQEGTYPLPEAQLDRFLAQIVMGYPPREQERRVLLETTGYDEAPASAAMTADDLMAAQRLAARLPIGGKVVDAILDLVRRARPEATDAPALVRQAVSWGPGPRAGQALVRLARRGALIDGRPSPSLEDVATLAPAVLTHRLILGFAARADGITPERVAADLVGAL
jgi:MoxR-like ATPase